MNTNERTEFRNSLAWKNFRQSKIDEQQVDYITGEKLECNANCHHLRLDHSKYNDLSDRNAFVMLNKTSHEIVHKYYNTGDWVNAVKSIPECERKQKLIEVMKMMDAYNTDSTELFLFSNHIDYTFDESDKPLVASLVRKYNIPSATLYGQQNMILWSKTTKESPKDMPENTKDWFVWMCTVRNNCEKLSLRDKYYMIQLRHLGLYSSYKNIRKKDRRQQWVINIMNKLEEEIKETTSIVNKLSKEV